MKIALCDLNIDFFLLLHYEAQNRKTKKNQQHKLETNFLQSLFTLIFISRMFPLFALPYFFTFEHYHCVQRFFVLRNSFLLSLINFMNY